MNKKFLSAILFGALMVSSTGTFVSCKDYDDEIGDLQEQINKLATKEDMSSQIATLQAALATAQSDATAAKTTAEQAVTKANSAESAATEAEKAAAQAALDAANAKVDAIKAAQDEVAKVKAELEATIDTKFDAAKSEFAETITILTEKVEKLTGLTTDMITSLDLQTGYEDGEDRIGWDYNYSATGIELPYSLMPDSWTVDGNEITSKEFGKGLTNGFTINAKELFTNSSVNLISVSPANAAVSSDMLSVINSKGESLDAYLDLSVEKYQGTLTRAAANTGLYAVSAKLKKNVDLKAFNKAISGSEYDQYLWNNDQQDYVKGDTYTASIAFALAATKEGRTVTSTYDLSVWTADVTEGVSNWEKASTIKSEIESEASIETYNGGQKDPSQTTVDRDLCYPVVTGKAFQIKLASEGGPVLASYITLDSDNALLSNTDKAALKNISVAGTNVVSKTNAFNLTITGDYATGIVIPLKVNVIDFLGDESNTVVWVKAGNSSEIAQTVQYTITPAAKVDAPTTYNYANIQAFTAPKGYDYFKLSIVDKTDGIDLNYDGTATPAGNVTFTFFEDAKGEKQVTSKKDEDVAKIAYAKFAATVNLQTMKDSKVYEGTVKFFDAEGTFLSQSTIKVQKVLPTALPAGFSIKTNQLDAQGVYNCYLIPDSWTAVTTKDNSGTMPMSHVFNFGEVDPSDYVITFAAALKEDNKDKDNKVKNGGAGTLNVANSYIDNKTQHTTTVIYNYGAISSEMKDNAFVDYTVDATSFPTVFNCIYNYVTPTYSWRWANQADLGSAATAKLPYKTTLTYGTNSYTSTVPTTDVFAKYIKGVSSRDGQYSAFLSAPYQNSLKIKEAHLVSNGNNEVDEYFKVEITADGNDIKGFTATSVSSDTNPTADVASTLKVTVYDMYGHEYVIELAMTVNPR